MAFQVLLQPLAEEDLRAAVLWAAAHAPETALQWAMRFQAALETLAENPRRCGFAPEHRKLNRELRQLLYGRKPNVFRAVFVIEGQQVRIVRIRRAAQKPLTRDELAE